MQTAMEEEFVFYSDDEDEKEFFKTDTPSFNKNSPTKFKLSQSLSSMKLYQTNSNHQSSPAVTQNNPISTNLKQFDWSATTYSSLLGYSNYFDNPPIDINYFTPKPLEQNYFDSHNLSTITHTITTCDNEPKHNPYQADPIHKQISNLINNTRPLHNLNSTGLHTITEKPSNSDHSYQSLILDQHLKQNQDHSSSMNYSSDSFYTPPQSAEPNQNSTSFSTPSQSPGPNHNGSQTIDSNAIDNQISNTDPKLPCNSSQNQKCIHPTPSMSPKPVSQDSWTLNPLSTASQPTIKKLTKTTSWSQIASKPAAPLPTPPPCLPSPKHTPSPPPFENIILPPPEYHRGPKVDPRWPIDQQLFLGPIPVIVTWDEIRTAFYNKVNRQHVVHTYVQSKPVNEVVYGMIVFDKATTATKILKEGPVAVKGYLISVSPMCQRLQARKK